MDGIMVSEIKGAWGQCRKEREKRKKERKKRVEENIMREERERRELFTIARECTYVYFTLP